MTAEIASKIDAIDKWIDALRGGRYKQSRLPWLKSSLGGTVEWCPLGVLCDVLKLKGDPVKGGRGERVVYDFDGFRSALPDAVAISVDLNDNIATLLETKRGNQRSAIFLEIPGIEAELWPTSIMACGLPAYKLSFSDIAEIIETNLDYLFIS